jgi:hypothetical protein
MRRSANKFLICIAAVIASHSMISESHSTEDTIPAFGRDTVLVWKITHLDYSAEFVARIAEFLPDRYLEWEDEITQGTIFMPSRDILSAKGFVSSSLFKSGVDTRGKASTTLWLSQDIFRELKEKKKVKCLIDETAGIFTYKGEDQLEIEINRSIQHVPVIKIMDDRAQERWFLDREDNPLLVSHRFRKFEQTLTSITTDRKNTLRWIKGKKLTNLPH